MQCSIEGCARSKAALGLCLMHYKRQRKHGSPEYRWGGRIVGRACAHCSRPVSAREMCMRHYQMWHRHGDALYADKKKKGGLPHGEHQRRGYKMVCPVAEMPAAVPADATTEKTHRHASQATINHGFRDGSKRERRQWQHRKIAGAKRGEIVHHIDLDPSNNDPGNLHVFKSAAAHGLAHRSLELAAAKFLADGLIVFDQATGLYRPA